MQMLHNLEARGDLSNTTVSAKANAAVDSALAAAAEADRIDALETQKLLDALEKSVEPNKVVNTKVNSSIKQAASKKVPSSNKMQKKTSAPARTANVALDSSEDELELKAAQHVENILDESLDVAEDAGEVDGDNTQVNTVNMKATVASSGKDAQKNTVNMKATVASSGKDAQKAIVRTASVAKDVSAEKVKDVSAEKVSK